MGVCPNCNAAVSPGLPSCNSCGTPLNQQGGGFCGSCGTPLPAKYAPCPQCGHVKTTFYNPNMGNPNTSPDGMSVGMMYKSEGTALILSIILGLLGFQGIGHLYLGRIGRGVGFLIGAILIEVMAVIFIVTLILIPIGVIFGIAVLAMFIWQIIDARNLCIQYNQFVHANGQRPW